MFGLSLILSRTIGKITGEIYSDIVGLDGKTRGKTREEVIRGAGTGFGFVATLGVSVMMADGPRVFDGNSSGLELKFGGYGSGPCWCGCPKFAGLWSVNPVCPNCHHSPYDHP